MSKKTVVAPKELTVANAKQSKEDWLAQLSEHQHLRLDLSEMEEIDTCGAQLLWFFHQCIIAPKTVSFFGLTEHAKRALAIIGMQDLPLEK
ncbi:STAS domain-containing protein [Aestuariibacter sp. AA17]|uniref:STAS domain-containing protein n=1 Tax=Fluctibacter corallii TaxID=2984329 RepID=A0ABT3ACR9_9ALTE|nr:STAS domain-containing protein [Aestuariibacter sp. AA17]MCV2886438.1 STAS domain-containing protein [Aestuariibacter sp. AA17]